MSGAADIGAATAEFVAATILFICAVVMCRGHAAAQTGCVVATFLQLAVLNKLHERFIDRFLRAIFS
jgi:hypothetical protein